MPDQCALTVLEKAINAGKPAGGTRPRNVNRRDVTIARFDVRNTAMQKTVVFKQILMLPFSRHRIMHRTRRTRFIGKARTHAQNRCANEVLDAQVRHQRMKFR